MDGVRIGNGRVKIDILRAAVSGQGLFAETTLDVRREDLDAKQDPMGSSLPERNTHMLCANQSWRRSAAAISIH